MLAYWISHRAIKTIYDGEDGLNTPVHDITLLKSTIYSFFEVYSMLDVILTLNFYILHELHRLNMHSINDQYDNCYISFLMF